MIKADHVTFYYGTQEVFTDVSFAIGNATKVGLAGPNGAGKSTLLQLILGHETPYNGSIQTHGVIGYVPQEVTLDPVLDGSQSVRAYLNPALHHQEFELIGILDGLELSHIDLAQSPKHLSGGQKTKLALAKALLAQPQILLLDEPTNFLDTKGKQWVANFLATYPHTFIMISHDLPLLDSSIDKILAINPQTKKIEVYNGNFTTYLKLKAERDALLHRNILNQQKHISRMEEGLRKLARRTSAKGVRQRVMLKRRIERMKVDLPEAPKELKTIKVTFPEPSRTAEIPVRAKGIEKSYGDDCILQGVTFSIKRGERVALIGHNGAGKSTLIKILVGLLTADAGEVILDEKVTLGYYSQEHETFMLDETLLENVRQACQVPEHVARPLLGKFLFSSDKIFEPVKHLSGGEKTRLAIAILMFQNNNVLILDEPTTYLDVLSQRVILEALKEYKGTMLVVSHTKEFIAELRPDKVLLLPQNTFDFWKDDYLEITEEI